MRGSLRYTTTGANWWKWLLAQPASKSPILDESGEFCAQGQAKGTLTNPFGTNLPFYLAGSWSGEPTLRKCTIPAGRKIVFPVINNAYFAFASDPADQKTEAFLRSQVEGVTAATNLEVEIDGVPVADVAKYLERSKLFSTKLPADNLFGLDVTYEITMAAPKLFQ